MKKLSLDIRHSRLEPSLSVVAPIFPLLNTTRIPAPSSLADPQPINSPQYRAVELAVISLDIIVLCYGSIISGQHRDLEARIAQPDGWPNIWAWMNFLHEESVLRNRFGDYLRRPCYGFIPLLLHTLAISAILRGQIINTPGVVEFATKLWIIAERASQSLAGSLYTIRMVWANALHSLADPTHRPEDVMVRILEASGGNPTQLARTALARVRDVLDRRPVDMADLENATNLVHRFSSMNILVEHHSESPYQRVFSFRLPRMIPCSNFIVVRTCYFSVSFSNAKFQLSSKPLAAAIDR